MAEASEDVVSSAYGWSTTSDAFGITIDSTAPEGGRVAMFPTLTIPRHLKRMYNS